MAFSSLKECRSTMQGPLFIRSLASSTDQVRQEQGFIRRSLSSRDRIPIGMIGVMVVLAGGIGAYTAMHQFCRSPSVQITKTKRECVPEVDYPDATTKSGYKFQNKSFLRKVAHIQDKEYVTTQANPFSRSRKCETLKNIGVPTQED